LLISQKAIAVEPFTQEGDRGFFRDYPPTGTLTLGGLPVAMAIAAIYRRVDWVA
jgi:hypothetical protein